jgi:hypothetical protein
MIEPVIEAKNDELLEFTEELSDDVLDRQEGPHYGSGWTFTACMS